MTPELRMAQMLSSDTEKQKLAHEMSKLSIEELEALVKESGVVLPFRRPSLMSRAGKALKGAAGKVKEFGKDVGKTVNENRGTSGFVAGALYGGHHGDKEGYERGKKEGKKKSKKASVDQKTALADAWGRELAKEANGDMLQYFQDNPDKLKEKRERDAKKDKKAYVEKDLIPGGLADKESYKKFDPKKVRQGAKVEMEHTNSKPIAREIASDHLTEDKGYYKKLKKMEKNSGAGDKVVERAAQLWAKHGPAVKAGVRTVGNKAHDVAKGIGTRIGKIENPIGRGAAAGATLGGIAGGVQGLVSPDRDPYTGEKKRLKTMLTKGLAGAATGGATGALTGSMQKSSSVQKLETAMAKSAAGLIGGGGLGSMAKNFVAQAKPMAQKAMSAATPHVQAGMKALSGASMGQAAGVGAAAGGALGAAKGLVAPGRNAQGQTNSRVGGALKGAVGGAVGGAALGAGAKGLSTRMR